MWYVQRLSIRLTGTGNRLTKILGTYNKLIINHSYFLNPIYYF